MTIVLFVIVIVIVAVVAISKGSFNFWLTPTPTEAPRINPEPLSNFKVDVEDVKPGKEVTLKSLELDTSAYVVVIKDGSSKNGVVLGKSKLLEKGMYSAMTISLNTAIKDGDVILVRLQDTNGKFITNDQKVNIEVKKNVGMLMMHYANEY